MAALLAALLSAVAVALAVQQRAVELIESRGGSVGAVDVAILSVEL